jgi:hypothetical protein
LSDVEDKSLRTLSMGIKGQTDYVANGGRQTVGTVQNVLAAAVKPTARVDEDEDASNERSAERRYHDRVSNNRLKEHARTVHEELTGGKGDYGRERQIEKRKQVADRTHGAGRDKSDATLELNDDAIFGSDEKGFQSALNREKQKNAKKEVHRNSRLIELQEKEALKQHEMMKKLGIQPGQTFTIKPRNDG